MVAAFMIAAFSVIIAFTKGVADITADTDNWSKSIFHECDPVGFFGPKDQTWIRKYKGWLFETILVSTTDIWHFANFINKVSWYGSMVCIMFIPNPMIYIILHLVSVTLLFHYYYHYLLRHD